MTKSILFIGNSYTYYNDMPEQIFAPMAAQAGLTLTVQAITHGGYQLSRFADPNDPEGQRLRRETAGKHYDCVILQDHSLRTVQSPEGFLDGIGRLRQLLENQADRFILYATWGRKPGCATLDEIGMTNEQMTEHIAKMYEDAGQKFGMEVAHVGRAFARHRASHPQDELYDPDMTHPSRLGSTLAAETILKVVAAVL